MTDVAGFRMGPFELFDLTALDVSHRAMESSFDQFYGEPRLRPSTVLNRRMNAGLFGRKSGRGFYSYSDGKIERPEEPRPRRRCRPPSGSAPPIPTGSRKYILG